jgi:hypothetical protein
MVSSFKDKDDERDENNDQRWKALSDKAEYKIIWRRLRLCQSRRPRHPHPCHKRVGASGGDQDEGQKEDSKILMADTSIMDDDAKAWYKMAQAHIMKEMMEASVGRAGHADGRALNTGAIATSDRAPTSSTTAAITGCH